MPAVNSFVILTHFENLTDPRIERTQRHNLLDIVFIALCATLCGADGYADIERFGKAKADWFRRFLDLPNGIPSHDTFGRVLSLLDTEEWMTSVQDWLSSLHICLKDQGVAIDGKQLRRSFDKAGEQTALNLVSAWAGELRLSLGQVAVDENSNEITAVPKLLAMLEIAGAVVTLDAMHCQKATTAAIVNKQADYVIAVKDNQRALTDTIYETFLAYGEDDYPAPQVRKWTTVERGHGREERRAYFIVPAPQALLDQRKWAGLRSIGMVQRTRIIDGKETTEVHYFISSLPPKVKRFARAVREHWGIENRLHWVLDVIFAEDDSRIRRGSGPEISGSLRRLAAMILSRDTSCKSSLRGKRLQAGWNNDVLAGILTGFSGN
jgi:predicted transposase YbfD/YdcC